MTISVLLNNFVTSLIVSSSLLKVVNNLFQTWNKQWEHNLSTACEQTCYNLFAGLLKFVRVSLTWKSNTNNNVVEFRMSIQSTIIIGRYLKKITIV